MIQKFPTQTAALAVALGLMTVTGVRADPVDDAVARFMDASHIPGVAVAVVDSGRIVRLQGYGQANLEWPSAVTPDTPFQTASASKIFAGVVLMRLVEQGVLSLDDPITLYFEGAASSIPPSSPTRRATAQRRSTRTSARRS